MLLLRKVKLSLKFTSPASGPVEVAGSRAAVHEEVEPGDERALAPQHELRELRHLVHGAGTTCRTPREHVLVEVPARPVELVDRQRRHALCCNARHMIGVQRVVDRIGASQIWPAPIKNSTGFFVLRSSVVCGQLLCTLFCSVGFIWSGADVESVEIAVSASEVRIR